MNYADRLDAAVRERGNPCVVGLDPHLELLPEEFAVARDRSVGRGERASAVADYVCEVIELVAAHAPAVKPQSAFFELFGADGVAAWERVVACAKSAGLLVIGDLKRGDIGATARAYARAYLDPEPGAQACDAITVNPLLGRDSLAPFLETCARTGTGLYVLVRTSNPDSQGFQLHGAPPLCDIVARAVSEWGAELVGSSGFSSVGAVVGATHPAELARLRQLMPHTPFLLPGYGAQGAGAGDIVGGFLRGHEGALVSSSRAILFAYREERHAGSHWKDATACALEETIAEVNAALAAARA